MNAQTTKDGIKVGRTLTCGCCGSWFAVWPEYIHQDQDAGFGICERCQGEIADHEEKEMDKAISTLRSALNEENKAKFDNLDRDKQRYLVFKALDDGIMKWSIGAAR